jgi:hypothetical protein
MTTYSKKPTSNTRGRLLALPKYTNGTVDLMAIGNMVRSNPTEMFSQPYYKYFNNPAYKRDNFSKTSKTYKDKQKNARIQNEGWRNFTGVLAGIAAGVGDTIGLPISDLTEETAVGQTKAFKATEGVTNTAIGATRAAFGDYGGGSAQILEGTADLTEIGKIKGAESGNYDKFIRSSLASDTLRTTSRAVGMASMMSGMAGGSGGVSSSYANSGYANMMSFQNNPYFKYTKQGAGQTMASIGSGLKDDYSIFKNGGNMKYARKTTNLPKFFLGGTTDSSSGATPKFGNSIPESIGSIFQMRKLKKQEAEAKAAARVLEQNAMKQYGNAVLDGYPTEGEGIVNYYMKNGGDMDLDSMLSNYFGGTATSSATTGGVQKPLSSEATLIEGNTHEDGGVKLFDDKGTPYAEVENGEIVMEDGRVFSNNKKRFLYKGQTPAQWAKKYQRTIGINEDKSDNSTNYIDKNTYSRNIEKAKLATDIVFQEQEAAKAKDNVTRYAKNGGKLPKYPDGTIDVIGNGTFSGADWGSSNNTIAAPDTNNYDMWNYRDT